MRKTLNDLIHWYKLSGKIAQTLKIESIIVEIFALEMKCLNSTSLCDKKCFTFFLNWATTV